MRTTFQLSQQKQLDAVLQSQSRLEQARDAAGSLKRLQQPSDAPAEIGEYLAVSSRLEELSVRQKTAQQFTPLLKSTENALADLSQTLQEARTLALQGNNSTLNDSQRTAIANQLRQIEERVLRLANQQFGNRYLFGGNQTQQPPFTNAGEYQGNNSILPLTLLDGPPLAANVTGEQLRNARSDTDLFQNLRALADAVGSGSASDLSAALQRLDEDLSHVIGLRADVGARIQYADLALRQLDQEQTLLQNRQSQIQDLDLAEAIIRLQGAETTYEATLAVAAQLGRHSLLDHLR